VVREAVEEVRPVLRRLAVLVRPVKDLREALVLPVAVFIEEAVAVGLAESAVVDREHQTAELVFLHQLLAPLLHVVVAVAVAHGAPTPLLVMAVRVAAVQESLVLEPQLLEQPILVVAVVEQVESAKAILADCVEVTEVVV